MSCQHLASLYEFRGTVDAALRPFIGGAFLVGFGHSSDHNLLPPMGVFYTLHGLALIGQHRSATWRRNAARGEP
jgi:hypothetical protein